MKIALVHDYLVQYGGAERVLECLAEIWPDAPIYTLIHDSNLVHHKFDKKQIRTSFLQKVPLTKTHHRLFPPLMMLAVEQFNFDYYDVVLSDSSSFAKNIVTNSRTKHICYCHTPMRYAWDDCQIYTQEFSFPKWVKRLVPFFMNYIRTWDFYSTNGVDQFIANSNFVAKRIAKYYHRDSVVINPPVNVNEFSLSSKVGDYYLMVGRMMKYKKMDLVIEAFNDLGLPLKIVGRGMEYDDLKAMSKHNIEFMGRISDEELPKVYNQAKGFIFPQEEDFGITAIEALASGRPVIAYKSGDIVENVVDGKSGVFFNQQTKEAIIGAVQRFEKMKFDSEFIRNSALRFERELFKKKIKEYVEKCR